jgi:hypothetical protein
MPLVIPMAIVGYRSCGRLLVAARKARLPGEMCVVFRPASSGFFLTSSFVRLGIMNPT